VDSALVVLQFVHPAFTVQHDLSLFSNSRRFKHGNYTDFIRVAEGNSNNANQTNMLEWKGNLVDVGMLVTREATTSRCVEGYMSMAMLAHMQLLC
jgi:hypothetical protein